MLMTCRKTRRKLRVSSAGSVDAKMLKEGNHEDTSPNLVHQRNMDQTYGLSHVKEHVSLRSPGNTWGAY